MEAQLITKIMDEAGTQLEKELEKHENQLEKLEDDYHQKVAARGVVFQAYCFLVID